MFLQLLLHKNKKCQDKMPEQNKIAFTVTYNIPVIKYWNPIKKRLDQQRITANYLIEG